MNQRIFYKPLICVYGKSFCTLVCLCFLFSSNVAHSYSTPVGLSLSLGTLGAGTSVTYNIENRLGVRIGANSYDFDKSITNNGMKFNSTIEISVLSSKLDWYPWATRARLTAGLISNSSNALATPHASNLVMDVNDKEIALADAGLTQVEMAFSPVAAYIGVGWGNAGRGEGLSLFTDLGVVFQGAPDVSLEIENRAELGLTVDDIKAQERRYESDLKPLRFYPVLTIGVSYNL